MVGYSGPIQDIQLMENMYNFKVSGDTHSPSNLTEFELFCEEE